MPDTSVTKAVKQLRSAASNLQKAYSDGTLKELSWYATINTLANYLELGPGYFADALTGALKRSCQDVEDSHNREADATGAT